MQGSALKCGLVTLVTLALLAASCAATPGGNQMTLEDKLAAAVEKKRNSGEPVFVEIKSIADFPWQRFYVFTPYTPLAEVRRSLGFDWPEAERTGIERRDDINLLVFVRDGKVVEHVEHPRRRGDFDKVKKPGGFTPDDAYFEVRREDRGEPWLALHEAPRR